MRIATAVIFVATTLSFAGCAAGPADDPNQQAAEEAQAADRVDDFVHNPPQ